MVRRNIAARLSGQYPMPYIGGVSSPRMHDAQDKKAMDARLARVEGQVRAVRRMIGEDRSCESIAQQLAAARKAPSTRWWRA
jgi:Metal-sensitive transcriptional repressor